MLQGARGLFRAALARTLQHDATAGADVVMVEALMLAVAEAPPAVVPRGSGGHNRLRSSLSREVENVRFSLRPQPSRTSARGPYGPSSPFVHPSHTQIQCPSSHCAKKRVARPEHVRLSFAPLLIFAKLALTPHTSPTPRAPARHNNTLAPALCRPRFLSGKNRAPKAGNSYPAQV